MQPRPRSGPGLPSRQRRATAGVLLLTACGIGATTAPAGGPVAPLRSPLNAAAHGMVMVPPLWGAYLPVEEGWLRTSAQADRDHGGRSRQDMTMDLDATFYEASVSLGGRLAPDWEGFAQITGASWDGDLILQRGSATLIPDETISSTLSDVVLGVRTQFPALESFGGTVLEDVTLGGLLAVKIPAGGHGDLVDTGSHDVAYGLLASRPLGPFWIHLQATRTEVGTGQAFETDETLRDLHAVGGAVGWRDPLGTEWIAQIQSATSPFREIASLDRNVVHTRLGARRTLAPFTIEAGAGWGADQASGKWSVYAAVSVPVPPPWPRISEKSWQDILR